MKTIWKFPLLVTDDFSVAMPIGAKIISLDTQMIDGHERPCVWALVDPEASERRVRFRVVGTGHPFPDAEGLEPLGSIQLAGGRYVFHVFISP
jgi:hypothetical protein